MIFKKTEAIPLSKLPAKVLIKWELSEHGAALKDYELCVHKQLEGEDNIPGFQHVDIDGNTTTPRPVALESKNLIPISVWIDALDFPWFIDMSDHLKGLADRITYRIVCRNKKTLESFSSEQFSWDGNLDLVGIYICDEVNFLLRDATGVPALVYQRKRGGVPCTSCFDPIQKKRMTSSCRNCYGTNWAGGFYNPLESYVDFSPNPKNAVVESFGEVNNNETIALFSNFPNVSPGDIVKELQSGRFWRIESVQVTEKRRCQMLQMARMVELKAGDIEHALSTDARYVVQKIEELNQIKHKPEF